MRPIDLDFEHLRINIKDVLYIVPIIWFCFALYGRLVALEQGIVEARIASLNMELSYMENRERNEGEERMYELKKGLVTTLMLKLEEMQ